MRSKCFKMTEQELDMTTWSSVTFEKQFLEDLDDFIEEKTVFSSRKEFLKHAAQTYINQEKQD